MPSSLKLNTRQFNRSAQSPHSAEPVCDSRSRLVKRVFVGAVILVAVTSMYDALLVFHYRVTIDEQNPFCRWLISLEPNYVSVFLLVKGIGTLGVVSVLAGLFKYWRRVAIPVAVSLVFFQAGLMTYLHGTNGRRQLSSGVELTPQSSAHSMSVMERVESEWKNQNPSETRGRRAMARKLANDQRRLNMNRSGDSVRKKKRTRKGPVVNIQGQ